MLRLILIAQAVIYVLDIVTHVEHIIYTQAHHTLDVFCFQNKKLDAIFRQE